MNPEDVYGELASLVVSDGECWHWHGDVRKVNTNYVPAVYNDVNRRYSDVIRMGLLQANVIDVPHGNYYRACDIERCMNPEHYEPAGTEVAMMVRIREGVTERGNCLMWNGETTAEGLPMLAVRQDTKRIRVMVRRFVYEVEHNVSLAQSQTVVTTCGKRKCVNHKHLAVKTREPVPYVPSDELCQADLDTLARREYAKLFMESRNDELLKEYV